MVFINSMTKFMNVMISRNLLYTMLFPHMYAMQVKPGSDYCSITDMPHVRRTCVASSIGNELYLNYNWAPHCKEHKTPPATL